MCFKSQEDGKENGGGVPNVSREQTLNKSIEFAFPSTNFYFPISA